MATDIWNWILNKETNKDLASISNELNVSVPGFRKGVVTDVTRPKIISLLLRPKNKAKMIKLIEINYEDFLNQEEYLILINEEIPKAAKYILENLSPSIALKIAIVHANSERAEQLFNELTKDGLEDIERAQEAFENKKQMSSDANDQFEEKEKKATNTGEEIKRIKEERSLKKLEQKIENLKSELENSHKLIKEQRDQWKKEKKELQEENQNLKAENRELKTKILDAEQEVNKNEDEIQRVINQKDLIWTEKENEIINLQQQLSQYKTSDGDEADHNEEKQNENNPAKRIALIGDPKNKKIQTDNDNITIIDKDDIKKTNLNVFDEVWILTYRISAPKQREILQMSNNKPIHLIDTFIGLTEILEKEMTKNER